MDFIAHIFLTKLTLSYCDGEAEIYLTAGGRDTTVYLPATSGTFTHTFTAANGTDYVLDFLLGGVNLTHLEIQELCTTLPTLRTAYKYHYNGKEQLSSFQGRYDYGFRMYDAGVARFLSVDPLTKKYPNQSPYNYCNDNPILFHDPDGQDGLISIKGGQIVISANVYIYGVGATKDVVDQFQRDINSKWGNNFKLKLTDNSQEFNVSIDVRVMLYQGKEMNDPLFIAESWNPTNRDNFIEVNPNHKRSYVKNGDEGVWRSKGRNGLTLGQDDPAAHELGHLLGLKDRYDDQNGPNIGWEKNIMGDSQNGSVDIRNINGILEEALGAYKTWKEDKKNHGKEFRYEINNSKANK